MANKLCAYTATICIRITNVLDFPSTPALAQYLTILNKNDTLYNKYFWRRGHYKGP